MNSRTVLWLGVLFLLVPAALHGDDFIFETQPSLPLSGSPMFPTAIDITGDGLVDLVVAHSTFVATYANDGLGGLLPEQSYDIGVPVLTLRVGNFNADTIPDLLVGTVGGGMRLHLGDGVGGFPLDETIPVGGDVPRFDVGDVNGDGFLDFVVPRVLVNPVANEVGIFLGTGTGDFSPPTWLTVDPGPVFAQLVDFDGNGTLDILIGHFENGPAFSGGVGFLSGNGLGVFQPEVIVVTGPTTDVTVADLDLDGDSDLVVTQIAGFCGTDATVLLSDGQGNYSPGQTFPGLCGPFGAAIEDFDGDGFPDILLPDGGDLVAATNYHEIWHGTGGGTFIDPQLEGNGVFTQTLPAVADFDGDGQVDFAGASLASEVTVFRNITGGVSVEFSRGDANNDGSNNIADAVTTLQALFGPEIIQCLDAADANDDGAVNIADPIFTLAFLFTPGAPPFPQPWPQCGNDPTPDSLPCEPPILCP